MIPTEAKAKFLRKFDPVCQRLNPISSYGGPSRFSNEIPINYKALSLPNFIDMLDRNGGGKYVEAQIDITKCAADAKKNNVIISAGYFDLFSHKVIFTTITGTNNVVQYPHEIGELYCETDDERKTIYPRDTNLLKTYYEAGLGLLKIIKTFPGIESCLLASGEELTKEKYLDFFKAALSYHLQPWLSSEDLSQSYPVI